MVGEALSPGNAPRQMVLNRTLAISHGRRARLQMIMAISPIHNDHQPHAKPVFIQKSKPLKQRKPPVALRGSYASALGFVGSPPPLLPCIPMVARANVYNALRGLENLTRGIIPPLAAWVFRRAKPRNTLCMLPTAARVFPPRSAT